jgi:phospholipid/cholesterol/gamma-HCH transport system ATP-binding protein
VDLSLETLSLQRGNVRALSNLSVDFKAGSRVVVWGPAGCGKTSLLKVLAGLLKPTAGVIRWSGDDLWALPLAERRRRQAKLTMIFQTDALFDSLSVLDNVLYPLVQREVPASEAKERAEEALRHVHLEGHAQKKPADLSGGMRKRAGIARALASRPEVILADDPFAGLDPVTEKQIADLLLEVSEGKTLIVALPDPVASLPIERALLLESGSFSVKEAA